MSNGEIVKSFSNNAKDLKLYNELANYYFALEEVHRNMEAELKFLFEELPLADYQKILDLGCGSGEHMEVFRKNGYDILGIDLSSAMIQVAKKRFPRIKVIEDNISQPTITGSFDAVISMFGTWNYLLDDLAIKKSLRGVYNRLKTGGKFILEVWNAEPIRKIRQKNISNVSSIIYEGLVVHRNRGFQLVRSDAKTIVQVDYLYQIDDREIEDRHYMRAFFRNEIEEYLKENGFTSPEVYGDFARNEFRTMSSRLLIVTIRN